MPTDKFQEFDSILCLVNLNIQIPVWFIALSTISVIDISRLQEISKLSKG